MFKGLNNLVLLTLKMLSEEAIIVMSWTFVFEIRGKRVQNCIQGLSWIQVNEKGLFIPP